MFVPPTMTRRDEVTEFDRRKSVIGLLLIALCALLVAGLAPVVAESGVSDGNLKAKKGAVGLVTNVPCRHRGARKRLSMYLVGEGSGAARARVVSGAARLVTDNEGTEVERAEPDQPITLKFTDNDEGYNFRFVTPDAYAQGILRIRIDDTEIYHLLDSNSFAIDIVELLELGCIGFPQIQLELMSPDLSSPVPVLSISLEVAQDNLSATIRY